MGGTFQFGNRGASSEILDDSKFIVLYYGKFIALKMPGARSDYSRQNTQYCAYNISGGETLSYRAMVLRVFAVLERRPRLLTVPLWAFSLAVTVLRTGEMGKIVR